ncbi:hypothetical protein LIER_16402 [Lithospermum erythrorhizon]|uniref:Transposase (putative) gypsy type domain-containing protein n=1 Tax=Lithospermum erythrorhizon TaxID=34254 RepID=A0AAV3Q7E2_LITER
MRLPFSEFVNRMLEHLNMTPGQIHPIEWLNITIFEVACKIARVEATVPLFASLFSTKHRPFDTSLGAKGGGRASNNFQAFSRLNKVQPKRFHGQWFYILGGMGPMVPISWTTKSEVSSLRFHRFSRMLVVKKPLTSGSLPIPLVPAKRSSASEASASATKCAKVQALETINAPTHTPTTSPTKVISLD